MRVTTERQMGLETSTRGGPWHAGGEIVLWDSCKAWQPVQPEEGPTGQPRQFLPLGVQLPHDSPSLLEYG